MSAIIRRNLLFNNLTKLTYDGHDTATLTFANLTKFTFRHTIRRHFTQFHSNFWLKFKFQGQVRNKHFSLHKSFKTEDWVGKHQNSQFLRVCLHTKLVRNIFGKDSRNLAAQYIVGTFKRAKKHATYFSSLINFEVWSCIKGKASGRECNQPNLRTNPSAQCV